MYWLFCVSVLFFSLSASETDLLEKLSKIKWLCANENCTEAIAEGFALRGYIPDHSLKVNFNGNDKILILGKPNATEHEYWLVQAGDKKGVAPVHFIREKNVIINQVNQVETNFDFGSIIEAETKKTVPIETIRPSPPSTVVEGTTISSYEEEPVEEIEADGSGEIFVNHSNSEVSGNLAFDEITTTSFNDINGTITEKAPENSEAKTSESIEENSVIDGGHNTLAIIKNQTDDLINVITVDNNQPLSTSNLLGHTVADHGSPLISNEKAAEISSASVPITDSSTLAPQTETEPTSPIPDLLVSPPPLTNVDDATLKEEAGAAPIHSFSGSETLINKTSELFSDPNAKNIPGEEIGINETAGSKEPVLEDKPHSNPDLVAQNNGDPVSTVASVSSDSMPPDPSMKYSSLYDQHHFNENDTHGQKQANNPEDTGNHEPSPPNSHVDLKAEETIGLGHIENGDVLEGSVDHPSPELHLPESEVSASEPTDDGQEEKVHESSSADGVVEGIIEDESHTYSYPVDDDSESIENVDEEAGFGNWFSGLSSVMSSFKEMFAKSNIGVDEKDFSTGHTDELGSKPEKNHVIQETDDNEMMHCDKEPHCSHLNDYSQIAGGEKEKGNILTSEMFEGFPGSQMSLSTITCLVITAVVVLLFSLGHYYLENLKQDSALIAKINTVSTELFFAQKELASIEEQYKQVKESYQKLISETSDTEMTIEEMRKELEESKAARRALEDEIKRLETTIESLVEEGDEMHRMLAESFSEEERTKSLLTNIADLKGVLSERLKEIVSLTEQLDKEKQEVELLSFSLKKSEEKREATEDKLANVLSDADSKTLAVTKEFEEKISTLERIIEERSLERTNFEKQICELNGACESLLVEKELAEKELKKAHGVSSGKALNEWLETKQLRADFLTIQKETDTLKNALEEAKQQIAHLEGREKELHRELETLNNKYESAEKEKIDALTRLQVLSNYFKEKEIQLQEELGIKEAQWLQKQSEDHTIYEQMRSLREENLSYKAQNEALKKEILDQETSFKIQIANEEQKGQENWINLRHTERRLKEAQMEAALLRSRITALEANPDSIDEKHKSMEMVNGDITMGAVSPPFMLFAPDFIPPPPLVSPTRPPPLGRLSSPPLTPPAPLSPFEFFPPPPPSPPMRVHKPQPREAHHKQKDSQSSNHSSESTEKPVRRGKR